MPVLSLCLWFKYNMDIDIESLRGCFGIVGITELRCLEGSWALPYLLRLKSTQSARLELKARGLALFPLQMS